MTYQFLERDELPENRFAIRLRLLRSAAGMTADAVAREAGLDPDRYRAYESGRSPVTAAALMRLAPALGVDETLFFDPA